MSKKKKFKKITRLESYKKIRKTWEINPVSRIVKRKRKTRQQLKRDLENNNE